MADQCEVLSNQQIDKIERDARSELGNGDAPLTWPIRYAFARAIERATIEAFREKHLKDLNHQTCYEIQRDELMAARGRIRELEAGFKNFHRSLCARFGYSHDEAYWHRDLVSLEEHIAIQLAPLAPVGANNEHN